MTSKIAWKRSTGDYVESYERCWNPLCWVFGHRFEGCTCDGSTCHVYGVWCPAEHCRRVGCRVPKVPLPKAYVR